MPRSSAAMIAAGGAWLVNRYFGLTFLSQSWFNEGVWAASLVLVGVISVVFF
jgi:hypothetical protein